MISKGKIVGTGATILVALLILSISVLRCASPKIAYNPTVLSERIDSELTYKPVDYLLAYPGKIHPDNPIWYLKVVRDKVWYTFTFNRSEKVELNLLFADKRLSSAILLFQKNKPDLGLATLTKAEKYLEKAMPIDTKDSEYLNKLALASLKHKQVIEMEILPITPEDLRPMVIKSLRYSKEIYKKTSELLMSIGQVPPTDTLESK